MRVALFIPCLVDQFYPEIGEAVADLLESLGLAPEYPEAQTCCGLPFYNMGKWADAERPARHFLDVFDGYDAVVTPSSSCAAMVKHFYARLFEDEPATRERAERVAARTHELTHFLVHEMKVPEERALPTGNGFEGTVAVHRSCHLRELGAHDEAERLIKAVPGVSLKMLPRTEVCCGFGGAFAIKFPVLSGALGDDKCDSILGSRADLVVTTDAGCMMQINGVLHRRTNPLPAKSDTGESAQAGAATQVQPSAGVKTESGAQFKPVRHIAELLAGRI